jgi:hypothetical protein
MNYRKGAKDAKGFFYNTNLKFCVLCGAIILYLDEHKLMS